eukprot:TRINITY_DN50202_c0_g1_i1.p1 TRINITY_DN50202_c0_g1~~TRINITY_DN50202_c0_g1_i1.p1  ORF type:complete len:367 (+),score=105.92 TRINITY_DN50202_c0_g1_i1:92-1192(+)
MSAALSPCSSLEQELKVASERLTRPEAVFTESAARSAIRREEQAARHPFQVEFRRSLERACVACHASRLLRELLPKAEEALESGLRHTVRLEFPRRNLHHIDWLRPGVIWSEDVREHGQHRAYSVYSVGGLMPALTEFFAQRSVRVSWRVENSGQVRLHDGSARQLGKYPVRIIACLEGCPISAIRRRHPFLKVLLLAIRRQRLRACDGDPVRPAHSAGGSGAPPPRMRSSGMVSAYSRTASMCGNSSGSSSTAGPEATACPEVASPVVHTPQLPIPMGSHAGHTRVTDELSIPDDVSDGVSIGEAFRPCFPEDLARLIADWVAHPDECALRQLLQYLRDEEEELYRPSDTSYLRYRSEHVDADAD